jgi:y4mF family transcriptional regulator
MARDWRHIQEIDDLAASIRDARREADATQVELAGIAGVGVRFVSEVENGKETAEVGKVLTLLQRLGLELWVVPRGGRRPDEEGLG